MNLEFNGVCNFLFLQDFESILLHEVDEQHLGLTSVNPNHITPLSVVGNRF